MQARALVCRELLATELGQRTPTTADLANAAGVGYGTVAAILRSLSDAGLVELTTHGQQGTRLHRRDTRGLWQEAGRNPLVGVLPLPHSAEFMALATAFAHVAEEQGLDLQLLFRQGSADRFHALRSQRVDWIITSQHAAAAEQDSYAHKVLGDYSYYRSGAVVVITRTGDFPDPTGRVPVDRTSHDHTELTVAEFPDAEYVDAAYLTIPELVTSGAADAAVWHQTSVSPLATATALSIHPPSRPSPADDPEISRAAMVWRREDRALATVLGEVFPPKVVTSRQLEVINGERTPRF